MARNEFSYWDKDRLKEAASRGGKKSAEVRRKKREMRESMEALLTMPMRSGKLVDVEDVQNFSDLKNKNISVQERMVFSLFIKALQGDTKAFEVIRDTIGQKPADKVLVSEVDAATMQEVDDIVRQSMQEGIELDTGGSD